MSDTQGGHPPGWPVAAQAVPMHPAPHDALPAFPTFGSSEMTPVAPHAMPAGLYPPLVPPIVPLMAPAPFASAGSDPQRDAFARGKASAVACAHARDRRRDLHLGDGHGGALLHPARRRSGESGAPSDTPNAGSSARPHGSAWAARHTSTDGVAPSSQPQPSAQPIDSDAALGPARPQPPLPASAVDPAPVPSIDPTDPRR